MQTVDILIAVVLVVAAVGSAVGVVVYDEDRKLRSLDVAWETETTTLEPPAETHTALGEVPFEFDVAVRNITTAEITVTIQASGPRALPTSVEVEVNAPGLDPVTETATIPEGATASTLEVPITIEVATVPTVDTVRAYSVANAIDRLNSTYAHDNGTGSWGVTVTFSGGSPGPLSGQETHNTSLRLDLTAFAARASATLPDISGGA